MKRFLTALLCCLLLAGCASAAPEAETTLPSTVPETEPQPTGYYDPASPVEAATNGAIRCYPLTDLYGNDLLSLGDHVLLIASGDNCAKLTVLSGSEGIPGETVRFNTWFSAENESLHRWSGGISFFDENSRQTLVLDNTLREVSRIPAPENLMGTPILSYDRQTLYYCTADSIRALELDTGISRCLKEISGTSQSVTGLLYNDTVLECVIFEEHLRQTLFLSVETGQILYNTYDALTVETAGEQYFASFYDGPVMTYLYGRDTKKPMALSSEVAEPYCFFLPEDNAAVTMRGENLSIVLDYYDLDTGLRTATATLDTDTFPWSFRSLGDGEVAFLSFDQNYNCQALYIWDTAKSPVEDYTFYASTYYTREEPDLEGLAEAEAYAKAIGEKYGIEVLIYKEAAAVEPYDYDLEYEHLVGVLNRELGLLEEHLANYPEGFLQKLAGRFEGLKICIVRSLTGTAESGSLDSADGIQFLDNYNAYIALAAASNTEYALYHELCHLIDTMVISESSAYDRWDQLNPKGFEYDYDYISNQYRDGSAYLGESNRSFIDTYSMSFPKEDRARIMEYAMTEGNASYFQSTTMQAKLKLLCEGIREAFGLRKSPETFLWEQYLNLSLAYTE